MKQHQDLYKLPDCSLLYLNENDETNWHNYLGPYLMNNKNLTFQKNPLFNSLSSINTNNKQNGTTIGVDVPGAFLVKLNKPIVMCKNTLGQLQSKLGIETINIETSKLTPFFELLAKTEFNNKILNDSYSVQLPDENQVYYITELDQANCMGIQVDKLLFTQPQDLLFIIEILRKQLLFNELLLSCMKTMCSSALSLNNNSNNNNYKLTNYNYTNENGNDNYIRILEIGLLDPFIVSIIMQHPRLLCYTTIEIDLSEGNIETKFRDHNDLHNPNVINEIIKRCHSIPITIRALLMKYKQSSFIKNKQNHFQQNNDNNGSNGNSNNNNNNNENNGNNGTRNYTNNNYKTNGNHETDHNQQQQRQYDNSNDLSVFQDNQEQITDQQQDLQITPNTNTTNRLTPSRKDSYNRSNSTSSSSSSSSTNNTTNIVKTPSSIFEFSNVINEQKQQQLLLMNKLKNHKTINDSTNDLTSNSSISSDLIAIDIEKNKELKCKNDENKPNNLINTPLLLKSNSFQTPSPSQKSKSIITKTNHQSNKTPLNTSTTTTTTSSGIISSANKKRKAPVVESQSTSTPNSTSSSSLSNASNQTSLSTPNTITNPPSAKRKMITNLQQQNDFKRHNSLIETTESSNDSTTTINKTKSNTPNINSNNLTAKKAKLKSSISSVDITSTSSIKSSSLSSSSNKSENNKKETISTVVSSSSSSSTTTTTNIKLNNKKEKELSSSGVLTAALINSNSTIVSTINKTTKLTNSTNKNTTNQNNQMKKSQSTKQLTTDNNSSNITPIATANKQNTSLTTSSAGQPPMKIKPITEDGMKIRISKDSLNKSTNNQQRSNSSSSINNVSLNKTNSINNLSATEIPLKHGFNSPSLFSSSLNSINNTPLSAIQQSNIRTPSPSSLLTSTSPIIDELNDNNDQSTINTSTNNNNNSLPKYEPPKQIKSNNNNKKSSTDSIYNLKPTSAPLTSSAAVSTSNLKPNTPPLPTSSNSLASFALGLGTSFKASSFKIPHKSKNPATSSENKEGNDDSNSSTKSPLATTSPLPPSSSTTASNSNCARSNSLGSPNKSTTPPQIDQGNKPSVNLNTKPNRNTNMPPPSSSSSSSNNNSRNSNSSPKWQPSYTGNISPRYTNNYDQTTAQPGSLPLLPPQVFPQSSISNLNINKGSNLPKNGNNNNNSNNKLVNQRSSSAGNRPLTPIPSQFSNHNHSQQLLNNNNRNNFINKNQTLGPPAQPSQLLAHPVPLMPTQTSNKSIPSLMSFSNHLLSPTFSSKDNLMTPTSPPSNEIISAIGNNIIPETKIIKETRPAASSPPSSSSSIPQPPDSPVCETATIVIPKLIPLERNLTIPLMSTSTNDFYNNNKMNNSSNNQNKNKNSFSGNSSNRIKTKTVDIASPDTITNSEEDDDNLVIDLAHMNNSSYSTQHIIASGSSNSMHVSSSRNIKSPCILEEDLVNNEALIS